MTASGANGRLDPAHRENFLGQAREMIPALRERAHQAERDRRMPDETHRAFVEAGFYRLFQPARYGGHEKDWRLIVDMSAELGRGCASSAWLFSNISGPIWLVGMHYPETQDEVWGEHPGALIASSFPASGATATRVDDGLEVDGT